MREILFRGKRLDDGAWVYGWYCKYAFSEWPLRPCIIPSSAAEGGYIEHVEVDPATVGPYTGRTDKNGVKIFTGDVIRGCGERAKPDNFVIRWNAGICSFTAGEGKRVWPALTQATISGYRVIGNIYDNPELLEGGNDAQGNRH